MPISLDEFMQRILKIAEIKKVNWEAFVEKVRGKELPIDEIVSKWKQAGGTWRRKVLKPLLEHWEDEGLVEKARGSGGGLKRKGTAYSFGNSLESKQKVKESLDV